MTSIFQKLFRTLHEEEAAVAGTLSGILIGAIAGG